MIQHNGQHGRLECSDNGPALLSARPVAVEWRCAGITVNAAGWKGVRRVWHNCQHGRLEGSVEGPT